MKKCIIALAFIICCINLSAQPPQGGRGGGRPDGNRPPMDGQMQRGDGNSTSFGIMKMPEIPDLTSAQREKLVKALTDEQKNVSKLMSEKHDLMTQYREKGTEPTEKERNKQIKKIEKLDEKIVKAKNKSDEKIRSILTPEQYQVFTEKRDQVKFNRSGGRSPMDGRRERPMDGEQRPPMPPADGKDPFAPGMSSDAFMDI